MNPHTHQRVSKKRERESGENQRVIKALGAGWDMGLDGPGAGGDVALDGNSHRGSRGITNERGESQLSLRRGGAMSPTPGCKQKSDH